MLVRVLWANKMSGSSGVSLNMKKICRVRVAAEGCTQFGRGRETGAVNPFTSHEGGGFAENTGECSIMHVFAKTQKNFR